MANRGRIGRPGAGAGETSAMKKKGIVDSTPRGEDHTAQLARHQQIAADALAEARALGASSAEVSISSSAGLSANVRMGEVETIEHTRDKALAISIYIGKRKGSASTSDFSQSAVKECVASACAIARYTAEDPYAGLADASLMATDIPDLRLYHTWDVSPEQAIDMIVDRRKLRDEVASLLSLLTAGKLPREVSGEVLSS